MKGILEDYEDVFTTYLPEKSKTAKSTNKASQKKLIRKEAALDIINQCGGLPKSKEFIDVIVNGQSNAGGFYEAIRDIWGKVEYLAIATWIINRDYINILFDDLESGKLNNMVFIISNRMGQLGKGHSPNFNVLKTKAIEHPRVEFRVCNSHAKVYCMTNNIDYITISGSGNWSENPRLENYCISNDKNRFDFHKAWMHEVS